MASHYLSQPHTVLCTQSANAVTGPRGSGADRKMRQVLVTALISRVDATEADRARVARQAVTSRTLKLRGFGTWEAVRLWTGVRKAVSWSSFRMFLLSGVFGDHTSSHDIGGALRTGDEGESELGSLVFLYFFFGRQVGFLLPLYCFSLSSHSHPPRLWFMVDISYCHALVSYILLFVALARADSDFAVDLRLSRRRTGRIPVFTFI